jgi:two-component system nitrate/nitrite response regulator NarL
MRRKPMEAMDVVKTNILVVDDHPIVRDGLAMLINCETNLTVVARAGNAAEAVKALKKHTIDLAIVDMLFKDTTGIHITQKIKAMCPRLVVLMFSMSDKMLHIQQAFEAGARGYIIKDELSEKIIHAIKRVLEGKTYLSKRLSKIFTSRQLTKLLAQDDNSRLECKL